jgi:hypothetical protein
METIKLEKSGNFMWVTDLKTNTVTRFPAKDTYYAFENRNKILVITWDKNNGETYHRYNVSELVDSNEDPWSSFSALDTFLASNLGFNGGGGTSGTTQNLSETLGYGNATGGVNILINDADAIELENTSSLKKGTYNFGGNGGISRICSNNYEDMWQNGFRHVFDQSGFIRHSTNCFDVIPNSSFDVTLRFSVGSFWTLDDGTTYKCLDATEGAAYWELYSSPPKYKVFTALLTQSGGDNIQSMYGLPLVIGTTYVINNNIGGIADFTNVGAPNNDTGTHFIATGTTPNNWGTVGDVDLGYNTGAPVAKVLENTIGNIYFKYVAEGLYECKSYSSFTINKTTIDMDAFCQNGNPTCSLIYKDLDISTFTIGTYKGDFGDSRLSNNRLEIRVYN